MPARSRKKIWLAVPACLLGCLFAYLLVVAIWAWASFDDALAGSAPGPRAPLSARQKQILLTVEDPDFYDHIGVSAAKGQGVANISSAVARDVYLDGADFGGVKGVLQRFYRAVFDCCKKIDLGRDTMAVVLNAKLPKERQLQRYVAHVYMGTHGKEQIRGLPRAALAYLGKPLERATDAEFTGLVAMIKAPNLFHPVSNPGEYAVRVKRVSALVSGACRPAGILDTSLEHCGAAE